MHVSLLVFGKLCYSCHIFPGSISQLLYFGELGCRNENMMCLVLWHAKENEIIVQLINFSMGIQWAPFGNKNS